MKSLYKSILDDEDVLIKNAVNLAEDPLNVFLNKYSSLFTNPKYSKKDIENIIVKDRKLIIDFGKFFGLNGISHCYFKVDVWHNHYNEISIKLRSTKSSEDDQRLISIIYRSSSNSMEILLLSKRHIDKYKNISSTLHHISTLKYYKNYKQIIEDLIKNYDLEYASSESQHSACDILIKKNYY
jgi:hypothetical protein